MKQQPNQNSKNLLAKSQYRNPDPNFTKAIYFGGGVTRNKTLRKTMQSLPLPCFWPKDELCLDNAAMIAGLGAFQPVIGELGALFTLAPKTRIMWE